MSPRIDVHSWLRHLVSRKGWSHHFSLSVQSCFTAGTMKNVTADVVELDARSTDQALACVSAMFIERGKASRSSVSVWLLLSLVLAQALGDHPRVQADPEVQQELHVVQWLSPWPRVGCKPQGILITSEIAKLGGMREEERGGDRSDGTLSLSLSQGGHAEVVQVKRRGLDIIHRHAVRVDA